MNRQDMQGVRSPTDIERKYDLGAIAGLKKATKLNENGIQKTNSILENFADSTIKNFREMQEQMDENINYTVSIDSSNGLVFKNGDIESVLTVKVRKGNEDITDQFTDTQFCWTRVSKDSQGDILWNATHKYTKTVTITEKDIPMKAIFNVILNL